MSFFVRAAFLMAALVAAPFVLAQQAPVPAAEFAGFGGVHELNLSVAHSWHGGPILGFVRNSTYTTVMGRYSYQLLETPRLALRWSPEVTVLAALHENSPSPDNIHSNTPLTSYGAGISPGNMQLLARPGRRVQPFLGFDAGILLYNQPVLSDGGTKFMFTVDAGAGANFFISRRDALNVSFRYQHQSNADIGLHNPGADAELFCFGYSHFFTLHPKGQ